jgi:hypothetical protein
MAGDVLLGFTGRVVAKLRRSRFIPDAVARLNDQDLTFKTVKRTIEAFTLGTTITAESTRLLTAAIAGNVDELRADQAVMPWVGQPRAEWAIATIAEAHYAKTPVQHISGTDLLFSILTGAAAGQQVTRFLPDSQIKQMARRIGLLGRREYKLPHYREFVRLYCFVQLPAGETLEVESYHEQSGLNTRNRAKTLARRNYKQECPEQSSYPCHFCHKGYVSCPQGTHRNDYITRECANGHDGAFDPGRHDSICMACSAGKWRAQH